MVRDGIKAAPFPFITNAGKSNHTANISAIYCLFNIPTLYTVILKHSAATILLNIGLNNKLVKPIKSYCDLVLVEALPFTFVYVFNLCYIYIHFIFDIYVPPVIKYFTYTSIFCHPNTTIYTTIFTILLYI